MEKLLISLTVRTRVEPDINKVLKCVIDAQNGKGKLWVLGKNGSRRALVGAQVDAFGTVERYQKYAQAELLYFEPEPVVAEQWAFSPGADVGTRLPVLLERYDMAFARRSYTGAEPPAAKQAELELHKP